MRTSAVKIKERMVLIIRNRKSNSFYLPQNKMKFTNMAIPIKVARTSL